MKHYELSVLASSANKELSIEGVYQSEKNIIVLANLKSGAGAGAEVITWKSVALEIEAAESKDDLPVECYMMGGPSWEDDKAYKEITQEEATKLTDGLTELKFTKKELNPNDVEFVNKYKERRAKQAEELDKKYADEKNKKFADEKKQDTSFLARAQEATGLSKNSLFAAAAASAGVVVAGFAMLMRRQ